MTTPDASFELIQDDDDTATMRLVGNWVRGCDAGDIGRLRAQLQAMHPEVLVLDGSQLMEWDAILMPFLLQVHDHCSREGIETTLQYMPDTVSKLLEVATAVPAHTSPEKTGGSLLAFVNPRRLVNDALEDLAESMAFIGEAAIAMGRLLQGKANTRFSDFRQFCFQAGPDAFAIISLTSILVGMILAYLGAVQLQQFGAEIYVADLVVIGTLREMGVLMTAVVMAGRTGAAYAAQLGTMQTNEEIDAIKTMGISPMEFLVMPRMLALVAMMPLLTIYANLLGILGGGIVAGGMGIGPIQYMNQSETALLWSHISVGLVKSVVFGVLIAIAGCRSGINSGRSSAAVGKAATDAVVTSVIYLIVADAAINIFFQQVGI